MVVEKKINGKVFHCSKSAADFFKDDPIKQFNADVCIDIMQNCIDTIYDMLVNDYPNVFKPELFFAESNDINAFAVEGKYIVVTTELIFQAADLLKKRYTLDLMNKYGILRDLSHSEILSCMRVYFWRYVVLHELYHIWNGHYMWKQSYVVDPKGKVVLRASNGNIHVFSESENADINRRIVHMTTQDNLTQQALELDADSSAIAMLIHLLMRDAEVRRISDKKRYVKNQLAAIFGAVATAFCLFDGNSGAKFESLNKLMDTTHPLPAIRMFYAEETANEVLCHYFQKADDLTEVEHEWQKIVCDIEPECNGKIDMGQVFYFTAYTEKAQRHLLAIKQRMRDIFDTLSPFVLGNHADKLNEDEITYFPEAVAFTDDGVSTRGWINPATGKNTAVRAKQQPIVKSPKIGRNAPCPCGSGLKYKKCKCKQYHLD